VYCKFGLAAEAAQLFETELGTLLLGATGAENAWHVEPDPEAGRKLVDEIDDHTLGRLLGRVKQKVGFSVDMEGKFTAALKARNRLMHGFFEKHNFRIQTESGRDKIVAALEVLHSDLFNGWQLASEMTSLMIAHLLATREGGITRLQAGLADLLQAPTPTSPERQVAHEMQIHVLKQVLSILGDKS
jgi:hypothetical protein